MLMVRCRDLPGEHAGTAAEGGEAWGPKQRAELEGPVGPGAQSPRGKTGAQGRPGGREGGASEEHRPEAASSWGAG